mmetsp:Transcript_60393/g.95729  ORF Transcript_60393/g.95729 Transcript_60393/m.95729 type:complete len:257 (-) Transcript_60393:97-867(-)
MVSLPYLADWALLLAPTWKDDSFSAFTPKWQAPWPSLPSSKPNKASFSLSAAVMSIAPAPSPKRTQVPRSDQSTQRERPSAPITRTFLKAPERTYWAAVTKAKTKPEQAAVRSKATAFVAPIMEATCGPVPKRSSGVEVAWSTRSTSSTLNFASSSAFVAAFADKDANVSSSSMTCLRRMPVRWVIHSSVVSMTSERSSLETTISGATDPVPATAMPKGSAFRRTRGGTRPPHPTRPARWAPRARITPAQRAACPF